MIQLYKSDVKLYLSAEVAEILGCTVENVARLCKMFDAPRLGVFFLINEELLQDLKKYKEAHGRVRKPRK